MDHKSDECRGELYKAMMSNKRKKAIREMSTNKKPKTMKETIPINEIKEIIPIKETNPIKEIKKTNPINETKKTNPIKKTKKTFNYVREIKSYYNRITNAKPKYMEGYSKIQILSIIRKAWKNKNKFVQTLETIDE